MAPLHRRIGDARAGARNLLRAERPPDAEQWEVYVEATRG